MFSQASVILLKCFLVLVSLTLSVNGTLGSIHTELSNSDTKIDSLAIAKLANEMAYPTHSLVKSLAKICLFPQA